ncbi:hypothetical protein [Bordetella pertussis]|uniref:hypothetical protein n=1 Tax=Bordetella pertussis TaxID=520 RepID=UPI0039B54456
MWRAGSTASASRHCACPAADATPRLAASAGKTSLRQTRHDRPGRRAARHAASAPSAARQAIPTTPSSVASPCTMAVPATKAHPIARPIAASIAVKETR